MFESGNWAAVSEWLYCFVGRAEAVVCYGDAGRLPSAAPDPHSQGRHFPYRRLRRARQIRLRGTSVRLVCTVSVRSDVLMPWQQSVRTLSLRNCTPRPTHLSRIDPVVAFSFRLRCDVGEVTKSLGWKISIYLPATVCFYLIVEHTVMSYKVFLMANEMCTVSMSVRYSCR